MRFDCNRWLRRWQPDTETAREVKRQEGGYFTANQARMNYPEYLQQGWPIGSGAVEGLARRMGRRLKVPGRGWCAGNLDGMAALVASLDTPEWDGLWSLPAA